MLNTSFNIKLFYGVSLAFIALNALFITQEFYLFMALPLAALVVMLFFFSLEKLLMAIVFFTPFTIKFKDPAMNVSLDLPTEPIIIAIMVLFLLKVFYEQKYDKAILKHPLSIALLLNLLWMFVTTITSEIPLVSAKYFISRLWFVIPFYFLVLQLFKYPGKIRQYLWLFGSGLAIVIILISIQHAAYGFERKVGTWIVRPFFNDHTLYSAVIALIAPVFAVMAFYKGYSLLRRRIALVIFSVFLMGIVFSYSRASWLSIMIAASAAVVLILRIDYKLIFATVILIGGLLFLFQDEIIMQLERNTQESSGDFSEHLRSVSNITSDASNLERINRWRAAYRMFEDRPILGWGPGTYMFVYAPYQLSQDETIITTNFGDLGNAHSEYLSPLSESGLPGMLLFIYMAVMILITGIKKFKNAHLAEHRWIALGITLGFITYFSHGFLNNFLETDKISVLFWAYMAMLVAMDIYFPKNIQQSQKNNKS